MRAPHTQARGALLRIAAISAILGASLTAAGVALADIEVPVSGISAFIQTSGHMADLGVGDYRTNDLGDQDPHDISIVIPCVANTAYRMDLFDPAVDTGPAAIDEVRNSIDQTNFRLTRPDASLVQATSYTTGTSNDAWTTFATITLPASPVEGVSCGSYTLEISTGDGTSTLATNNDDNAWMFRLVGTNDGSGNAFAAENGPDDIPGTGDEPFSGLQHVSYQHSSNGTCQDFYWFVPDNTVNMAMLNFDMDGSIRVCYFPPGVGGSCTGGYPGAPVVAGTLSTNTFWNDIRSPKPNTRPVYGDMASFDGVSDFAGDQIAAPQAGLWRAQICVNTGNQYSFEVPGYQIYLSEPEIPDIQITKTDGITDVDSPGTTTYTLTVTNAGIGAAIPTAGPELIDTLPPGMTVTGCAVNAPLVGSCSGIGTDTISFNFLAQPSFGRAYLPGVDNAPNNAGTVTVSASVAEGVTGSLLNVASVDWTDVLTNNYEPVEATDTDIASAAATPPPTEPVTDTPTEPITETPTESVTETPPPGTETPPPDGETETPPPGLGDEATPVIRGNDPIITKSGSPDDVIIGERFTWTITVSNPGTLPTIPTTVTDTIPGTFDIVSVNSTRGTVSIAGDVITVEVPSLTAGQTAVITIVVEANESAQAGEVCNTARSGAITTTDCVTMLPNNLPATGGRPVGPTWPFLIAGIVAGIGLGALGLGFAASRAEGLNQ